MVNLTLVVDEQILRRARIRAMRQGTSVNALVREYITRLAGESDAAEGIAEFLRIGLEAHAESGGRTWTRESLYDV